jgi:dihydrofolate reductase
MPDTAVDRSRTRPQVLALIAAVARNGVIGRGNDLVFHDPADQKHFRAATLGCPVIMGRKTWESLPKKFRPLPGRRNLVVTSQPDYQAPGADVVHGFAQAIIAVADAPLAFVIGGGELYTQALPLADRLLLTEVDADLPGDIYFPDWPRETFVEQDRQQHQAADGTAFAIVRYERQPTTRPV